MRRTIRPLFLALAMLAAHATLASAPARADLVVGTFSGTITSVQQPTDTDGPRRILPDVVPAVGDPFSGVFGYFPDPAGYDSAPLAGTTVLGITYEIDGQRSHNENLDFYAAVFTGENFDSNLPTFFVEAYSGQGAVWIGFDDLRRPFPADGAVVGTWTEADFATRLFAVLDLASGLRYTGTIDRLTLQATPEPAGWAAFAVGGAGLAGAWGWRRLRRRPRTAGSRR